MHRQSRLRLAGPRRTEGVRATATASYKLYGAKGGGVDDRRRRRLHARNVPVRVRRSRVGRHRLEQPHARAPQSAWSDADARDAGRNGDDRKRGDHPAPGRSRARTRTWCRASNHPQHTAFLRWLVFLVAAVYPTFTFGDVPKRWVAGDEDGRESAARSRPTNIATCCGVTSKAQVAGPWFLGDTWSALDLYMWPMTFWRPGRDWFKEHCPKLHRDRDGGGRRSPVQGRQRPQRVLTAPAD